MATVVDRWIGTKGNILTPIVATTYNTGNMISLKGEVFIAQIHEVVAIEAGNPMGLLLTLTYPATP